MISVSRFDARQENRKKFDMITDEDARPRIVVANEELAEDSDRS
jgi:hypothetical protein